MSDYLNKIAAGPLGDANKLFLPEGKRAPRAKRTPEELEIFREERQAKVARLERERAAMLEQLLAYYAASSVPIKRVAKHLGLTLEDTQRRLAEHGRKE